MRRPVLLLLAALAPAGPLFAQTSAGTAEDSVPAIHVVLFTAAGLEAPADAEEKVAASAEYAEAFLVKWMKHWKYPPVRERIFPRDEQGRIRVLRVQGSKRPEEYEVAVELMKEVWSVGHERQGLPKDNPIWWVWVYKGDPPTRFSNYKGSGDLRRGGWAVVNYENKPIEISPGREMAAGDHEAFTLKGCVHELGHALGVFHIGPRDKVKLGNTLMGPRTAVYRKDGRGDADEERVYLSEAEAALLWKHWAFSGTTKDRGVLPSVEVKGYKARHDRNKNEIVVTGTLASNGAAHSVVLVDEAPPRQEDYWRKAYAARLEKDGRFEVRVREPSRASGTFRLMFCFENGAVTGDGKTRDLNSASARKYDAVGKGYRFEP